MSEATVIRSINQIAVTAPPKLAITVTRPVLKVEPAVTRVLLEQPPALTVASPGPQGPPGPEGPRGVPGSAGGSVFRLDQTTPAATWNVVHNLGRYPHVSVLDDGDNLILTDVFYADLDSLVLTFPNPVTGKAVCS